MTVGEKIAQNRTALGMTRVTLAEEIGVSEQAVANWEHDRRLPNSDSLAQLCRIFDVALDELIGCNECAADPQNLETDATSELAATSDETEAASSGKELHRLMTNLYYMSGTVLTILASILIVTSAVGVFACVFIGTSVFDPLYQSPTHVSNHPVTMPQFFIALAVTVFALFFAVLSFVFARKLRKKSKKQFDIAIRR